MSCIKTKTKTTPFKQVFTDRVEIDHSSCAQRGEERLEKTRQMELQLPELSYVVVPS